MFQMWEITGATLEALKRSLDRPDVHTLRVAVDDGTLKFKINEGMWTSGIEGTDPPIIL
jgi:hypothetical protein